ncbi:MAG: autotransporter assembly complex family protein [Cocleimonas sp.]
MSLNTARSGDAEIEEIQKSNIVLKPEKKFEKTATEKTKQLENNQAPLKLAKIDITGVTDDLKKNIELHMPISIPECDADRGDVKLFFNTVKKNLRKATRALGYYDAEFTSGGSVVNNCWKLRLKVTSGRPTKVVSQEIKVLGEGKDEEVFRTILKDYPYKIGDVLNHQNYSEFKTKLSEASQTLGYFDAEFAKHTIRIDPASYQAKVALVLNTGTRYRYGNVAIAQKTLSDKAVQKYLIIKSGQPFKSEDIIRQQQVLQQSGYYKTIKIEVLQDQIANNRVPISISLTPKKRNAYKFKVGFGSDTGARVSAELDRRWTGAKGRQLQIKTQYAQTLSGVSLRLVNPRDNPEDNSLVYSIDWTKDSNDDVTGRSINVGSRFVRKRSNGWIQSASINALVDRTQVEGEDETNSNLLLFGIGLEKVSADSLIFPTKGWHIRATLSAASEFVLSDQNVVQFTANAKRIMKIGSGRLLARANYGTTLVNDFERLPKSLRFFAGGGNSVRGFDFESLGELNSNNRNRGGKQLIDFSLEYQHPINESWSAAVFADAGNAFDDFKDTDLEVGVGFGARWRSPVGPVRIDLGFPTDDFSQPKLYLSVGADL